MSCIPGDRSEILRVKQWKNSKKIYSVEGRKQKNSEEFLRFASQTNSWNERYIIRTNSLHTYRYIGRWILYGYEEWSDAQLQSAEIRKHCVRSYYIVFIVKLFLTSTSSSHGYPRFINPVYACLLHCCCQWFLNTFYPSTGRLFNSN